MRLAVAKKRDSQEQRQALAKSSPIDPAGTPSSRTEIGRQGLSQYSGILHEEFLPKLRGQQGIEVFKEMRFNDATVGSIVFAITMLIRQVKWRVEVGGDDEGDIEKADFLSTCIDDMDETWADLVADMLSFLVYGHAVHEPVFKRRLGPTRDPKTASKHDDGRIGWQKIPARAQETLDHWLFDPDSGELEGVVQRALPDFKEVTIPCSRFLLFRTTTAKGNPEGVSILRTAYRAWYFKRRIEEIEGMGIERDLAGIPVAGVPSEMLKSSASDDDKALVTEIKKLVQNIRRDEVEGVTFPVEYDDEGKELYKLELLTTGGRRQFDTTGIIDRWDLRIAMTVLADFIMLGQKAVGSFALASSKTELFAVAIGAWLDVIEQIFNRKAIPQLFRLNAFAGDDSVLPELKHGDVESADLGAIADYIQKLGAAGALTINEDEDLEGHLRSLANLPARPEGLGEDEPPEPPKPKLPGLDDPEVESEEDDEEDDGEAEATA